MTDGRSSLRLIRTRLQEAGAGAALLTHMPTIRWATGFSGSNGALVVRGDAAHLVTDGRYDAQARAEVQDADVHVAEGPLFAHLAEHDLLVGDAAGHDATGSVVVQADCLTVAELNELTDRFEKASFIPERDWLVSDVAVKDEEAVAGMRRTQALTCAVFEDVLGLIRPGMTEQALAAEIVYQHLQRGCSGMAFDPIVASGARGALPHARPSPACIETGDLVVMDFGGILDGYCADLTRTVAVGEPGEEARRAYDAVLQAQKVAIEAIRGGVSGAHLDRRARSVLEEAGLVEYFTHSLGHGVGLEIHEWPRLSLRVEHVLPAGATVTVEPGIYVPGGFGIRIEDVVIVREGGHENITPASSALVVL